MLKQTSEQYSQYFLLDLNKKLIPIHQSVDEMLTRLEEFETMLTIVQQERCNSVGLTGSLTQVLDNSNELKDLSKRVDTLEKLVDHIKSNLDVLDKKVEAAEEHHGLTDSTSKIKNLLIPLFKKSVSIKEDVNEPELPIFSTEDYFKSEEDTAGSSSTLNT